MKKDRSSLNARPSASTVALNKFQATLRDKKLRMSDSKFRFDCAAGHGQGLHRPPLRRYHRLHGRPFPRNDIPACLAKAALRVVNEGRSWRLAWFVDGQRVNFPAVA